jgi:hypothetical protein
MTVHLSPSKDGDQFITTETVGGDFIQLILDKAYTASNYIYTYVYIVDRKLQERFSVMEISLKMVRNAFCSRFCFQPVSSLHPHHPFCFCIQVLFLIPAAPLHAVNS